MSRRSFALAASSRKWRASSGTSSRRARSGGMVERQDVEPVVEVGPEGAALARGDEVAVGRGDDAHVDLERLAAADALDLALLQDAQELGLHRQRHVADLVEEERAAARALELAAALLGRAGERARLVAEELGLDELAREARRS